MSGRAAWWICAVLISGCAGIRWAWCGARSKVIASSSARLVAWRCERTDLRRVSMCSHDGDLHVFRRGCMAEGSTARVHRPSRTWTSRCDRYCSGFSEFIRPWRGSRGRRVGSCPSATALGDHVTKVAGRPRSRMCPSDRRRRSARGVLAHGSLFDGAPPEVVEVRRALKLRARGVDLDAGRFEVRRHK